MRNNYFFKIAFSITLTAGAWNIENTANAQAITSSILSAGSEQANIFAKAYLSPLFKGIGTGMNGGWYNTAKTHNLGRFDLTFTGSLVSIPIPEQSFYANQIGLDPNVVRVKEPNIKAPTLLGDDVNGPLVTVYAKNKIDSVSFYTPTGTGNHYAGAPGIQFSIGLISNTDIMVRYVPTISFGNGSSIGLWGIGIKHELKQWIPVLKDRLFDIAIAAAYSKLTFNYNLESDPNSLYNDQRLVTDISAYNITAIISKKFTVLTLYGGLGFNASSANLKLQGTYKVASSAVIKEEVKDPINFSITGNNSFKLNAGFRLKLLFLTLHADATWAQYPIYTAGVGINIGK